MFWELVLFYGKSSNPAKAAFQVIGFKGYKPMGTMEFPNENSGIVHVYPAEPELRLAHELRRWSHANNQVKTENNGDV